MTASSVREPRRPDDDLTVGRVVRHVARSTPHKCALDDGRRQISYADLDDRVDRLAAAMISHGVGKGDAVAAYLPNCIEYVLVVLAVARCGAVFAPLNPRFTAFEIAKLLRVARPVLIFASAAGARTVSEALSAAGQSVPIAVTGTNAARGADESGGVQTAPADLVLDEMLGHHKVELPGVREDDLFSLMFTSGTTGEPKGALATHRARMLWVLNAAALYGLSHRDRYLGTMPQVHSAGLTFTLIHLHVGATVRILEEFEPRRFLEVVEAEAVSSALTVPTMLAMILEALEQAPGPYRLDSLRCVVTCGAPLPLPTKQRVLERVTRQLYDYYGSTESNSMTVLRPEDQLRKPASVGQPFVNVELMIATDDGRRLECGAVGEVWCSNPSAMLGYRDRPEASAAAFSGRWFRTGDIGYLDDEGFLFLVGRSKDMIISGGINIYPVEIEQVVSLHPAVLDCAIVGIEDPKWGQSVKAFVVLRANHRLTLAELQQHCASYLADFKKPRLLAIVERLPKNAGGKTVKSALMDPVSTPRAYP